MTLLRSRAERSDHSAVSPHSGQPGNIASTRDPAAASPDLFFFRIGEGIDDAEKLDGFTRPRLLLLEAVPLSSVALEAQGLKVVQCVRSPARHRYDMVYFNGDTGSPAEAATVLVTLHNQEALPDG